MRSRAWGVAALLALLMVHTAQAEGVPRSAADTARTVAVADGLSTYLALSAGAQELNPMANGSPGGLLVLTGLKFGLVQVLESSNMPEEKKRGVLRTLSAMWGAASVNNLLIAGAVNPPAALALGIISGVWWWRDDATRSEPLNTGTEVAVALQP